MSTTYTTPREATQIMGRVFLALLIREAGIRYGRLKIGYLWAFIQPILFVTVLSVIFSYFGDVNRSDIPRTLLYVTGLLPFFLYRDIFMRCMSAVQSNIQLLTFPQVQVFDLIVARALLEVATFFIVFTVLVGTIALFDVEPISIGDPLQILEAIILISLLGFGFGACLVALAPLFPTIQFLVPTIIVRPLFFLSGVFFTANDIPASIRPYALYNPLLQLIELLRSGFFSNFESPYINMPYIIGFTLATLFIGLLLQRALKRHATRTPI